MVSRQGCPCSYPYITSSCYLYIISLQPLLDMIERDDRLHGVSACPSPDFRAAPQTSANEKWIQDIHIMRPRI